jgi:hypothetical protein
MKLRAASGRGILRERFFYASQVAVNKTKKILRQAQDPRLSGMPAACKPAGVRINNFVTQNYRLTDLKIMYF